MVDRSFRWVVDRHIEYWWWLYLLQFRNCYLRRASSIVLVLLLRNRSLLVFCLDRSGNVVVHLCQCIVNHRQEVFSNVLDSHLRMR